MRVALTGATGFVGRNILTRLVQEGHAVHAVRRRAPTSPANGVQFFSGEVVTGDGLETAFSGCEAVIHLVGIIQEVRDATFERVHYQGTQNVLAAAKAAGVKRFVHMSALGAKPDGVSAYQTSKWKAEEAVRNSGINHVILRPSIIFGPGDGFVTQMADLMTSFLFVRPVVGHGQYQFQPVWIENLVDCFVQALSSERVANRTFELGGPERLTLDQMLKDIAQVLGIKKPAAHIPFPIVYINAVLLRAVLRRPPVTTDQLRMLREGSICEIAPMLTSFDTKLVDFRRGLERYLAAKTQQFGP